MLMLNAPNDPLPDQRRHRPGGVVWQPQYEGFTTIAYRDGHAVAGISGPWSNQYVLIWWQATQPVSRVELFDSLEDAKAAVARACGDANRGLGDRLKAICCEPIALPQPTWFVRLTGWRRRPQRSASARSARLRDGEETDLRGLNFRAVR